MFSSETAAYFLKFIRTDRVGRRGRTAEREEMDGRYGQPMSRTVWEIALTPLVFGKRTSYTVDAAEGEMRRTDRGRVSWRAVGTLVADAINVVLYTFFYFCFFFFTIRTGNFPASANRRLCAYASVLVNTYIIQSTLYTWTNTTIYMQ